MVLEGFEDRRLSDDEVNKRISTLKQDGAWDVLKRLRNATFHLQPDPQTAKFTDMLIGGIGVNAQPVLEEIRQQLVRFFRDWREANADLLMGW